MIADVLYGLIEIVILTVFCLGGAFLVPPVAYWFMTPMAVKILQDYGIRKKMSRKDIFCVAALIIISGATFVLVILFAGRSGVASSMSLWRLALRFLIIFWMTSIFDAVVLDWWMFTKTKLFGVWLKKLSGREPEVWSVDPQWDGKEVLKLILEFAGSVILAWIFLRFK
ncbi:MAG: hypothetical protein IJ757_07290 [Clostridiales bacterium]|nr:hypothetical protein [Clostridiales bacterium]